MEEIGRLGSTAATTSAERGRTEDGPWALVLAALGQAGRTGQLTVRAPGADKIYAIAFAHGVVVGATSPMAVDSVARIAAAMKLPPVPSDVRRGGGFARSNADSELDAYLAAAHLAPEQVKALKRRILVQRAARTFAIERGTYIFHTRVAIPVMLGVEVDVRAVVFRGALFHLDGGRIAAEFSGSAVRFALADGALAELSRFELDDCDKPVIAALREGTSAPEVEAKHRDLDPRRVQAVFYALATCGALLKLPPREVRKPRPLARGSVDIQPVDTAQGRTWVRLPTGSDACVPMLIRKDLEVSVQVDEETQRMPTRALTEPHFDARPTKLRPNALGASELVTLISKCSTAVESGADHFALLGVRVGASVDEVHAAYVELARNLRSERLAELHIKDREFRARSLLAQICIAYTVLTDPVRRAAYIAGLQKSAAPSAAELDFQQLAREAFERGARALRRDDPALAVIELRTACELAPNDIRYIATLGHAEFCVRAG